MIVMSGRSTSVLFIWEPEPELREYLTEGLSDMAGVKLIFPPETDEETLMEYASGADIMVGWRPTEKLLESAVNLRLFINPGAGAQHLIELFRKLNQSRDVILINGHGNAYFTAQHAVALLLALAGKVIPHHDWMHKGRWRRSDDFAASIPMRGRKIGLLGYGAVNKTVHKMLSGFDVEFAVLRRDRDIDANQLPTPIVKYEVAHLHQFLKAVDILIVAVPQTSKTVGMIGREEIKLLGTNGLLVNVARGSVIDENSLYIALYERQIAGAAIDVWYEYHPEADGRGRKYPFHYPFHMLDNIILSPHRAASPFGDLKRWDEVIQNITLFASGGDRFINVVNLDNEY